MSIIKTLSDPNTSIKILEDTISRELYYFGFTSYYYVYLANLSSRVIRNSGTPNYLKLYLYYS